ncbi:molybdopterin synthase sulfur carrier subunit-like [Rhizophagus clarus]|uniref:Molybdopterin synthase sulfur carrier subunit-like n=1 Tax=Rhizophagus clarus TaxID=94130 RepID=A0A8H3M140_9GLOM|nr:molybdopterin synthase sulfur carrier subunit-like [Rhizophagus clarus]
MSNAKEITILYFATARDATKVPSEKISLPPQSTSMSLEDLTNLLKKRHEKLAPILDNSLYSINMEYVEEKYCYDVIILLLSLFRSKHELFHYLFNNVKRVNEFVILFFFTGYTGIY